MKIRYICLLLLCFLMLSGPILFAQEKKVGKASSKKGEAAPVEKSQPEVRTKLKSFGSNLVQQAIQVEKLLSQAEKVSAQEPKKALDYVAEALSLSINQNYAKGEALSYRTLGDINYQQALYAKSVENYQKSLEGFKTLGESTLVYETKKKLAAALEATNQYASALNFWKEIQQDALLKARPEDEVNAKTSLARIYEKQGKEELALKNYKDVADIESRRGNTRAVFDANNNIGDIYLKQEKTKEARDYYAKSQNLAANTLSDDNTLTKSNEMLGKVYRLEKKYDEELALRQQSIAINLKGNNQAALSDEYLEVGKLYLEQNNAVAAIPYLQKSAALSDALKKLDKKSEAVRSLSQAYGQMGNAKEAMKTYQMYVAVMDVLLKQKEKEFSGLVKFKEDFAERQKHIESLESDRLLNAKTIELLRKEQKLKEEGMKKQWIVIYALMGGLLLVFVASYLLYRSSQKRRIANQLLALKSLRSQMNPHFIFNALNSVNSFISQNDERSANKYLSEFSKLMRAVMENSQHDLVPLSTELKILQLYLGLEHFRFKEKFDYTFEVDSELDAESVQIPPMLIQPYIENAVWHGLRYKEEKGFLAVKVVKAEEAMQVIVEDNGIGRKKSQAIKTANQKENVSTGLLNIENRLRIINEIHRTKLSVTIEDLDPAEESGTRVLIRIPLLIHEVAV